MGVVSSCAFFSSLGYFFSVVVFREELLRRWEAGPVTQAQWMLGGRKRGRDELQTRTRKHNSRRGRCRMALWQAMRAAGGLAVAWVGPQGSSGRRWREGGSKTCLRAGG